MATTLDWYGCATFRLKTAGLSIFLDAYIDRASNAPTLFTPGMDWLWRGTAELIRENLRGRFQNRLDTGQRARLHLSEP